MILACLFVVFSSEVLAQATKIGDSGPIAQDSLGLQAEEINAARARGSHDSFLWLVSKTGEAWFSQFIADSDFDENRLYDNVWEKADVAQELLICIGTFPGHLKERTAFSLAWSKAANPVCRRHAIRFLSSVIDFRQEPEIAVLLEPLTHDPDDSVRRTLARAPMLPKTRHDQRGSSHSSECPTQLLSVFLTLLDDADPIVRYRAAYQLSFYSDLVDKSRDVLIKLMLLPNAAEIEEASGPHPDWGCMLSLRTVVAMDLGRMEPDITVLRSALPPVSGSETLEGEALLFTAAIGNSIALSGDIAGFSQVSCLKSTGDRTVPFRILLKEQWRPGQLRLALNSLESRSLVQATEIRSVLLVK